jgi:alanyl-tRNA synthetase
LHHALQKHLGSHAQQQGSKVDEDWLRFDFTHMSPVSPDQLLTIERDANERIAAAEPVRAEILALAEARKRGATMLFGEKYPDPVRMVSIGTFSRELCGGTHLDNSGEVTAFEILSEEGVAAGTRRIVALTGDKAREHAAQTRTHLAAAAQRLGVGLRQVPAAVRELAGRVREGKKQLATGTRTAGPPPCEPLVSRPGAEDAPYAELRAALRETARLLNVAPFDVSERVVALQAELEQIRRQLEDRARAGVLSADALLERAEKIGPTQVVIVETPGANPNLMRQLIDQIRKKAPSTAVFLGSAEGESKVVLVAGLSRDLVARGMSAGDWVRLVAPVVGGGGGGKPDLAQAGGKEPANLPAALTAARSILDQLLSA